MICGISPRALHTQGGPSSERAIESGLKVPPLVAQAMEAYAQQYTSLKTPRCLHWKPHVGCVEMQVRRAPQSSLAGM